MHRPSSPGGSSVSWDMLVAMMEDGYSEEVKNDDGIFHVNASSLVPERARLRICWF
jgi:hypothetical protein